MASPMILQADVLGRLMPMFLWVDPTGHIHSVGPTLAKICKGRGLPGARLLEVFELQRPEHAETMQDLIEWSGRRLHLALREPPRTELRGIAMPLGAGQGLVLNLSFGIAVGDAVRDHGLTDADFAPTDLTVEMLYLAEVKAAVMGELDALNRRLQAARQEAEHLALSDPLTGLANRRALEVALDRNIGLSRNGGAPFALAHIDLDFFKSVNDTLGHGAGDHVLLCVAEILRAETRKQDIVARVGGDEFVLILTGMADAPTATQIVQRIIAALEHPIPFEGQKCRISGSVGLTFSSGYARPDSDRLLLDADRALYASKRAGRGRLTIYRADAFNDDDERRASRLQG